MIMAKTGQELQICTSFIPVGNNHINADDFDDGNDDDEEFCQRCVNFMPGGDEDDNDIKSR